MPLNTTISLTARADMPDEMQGFLHRKTMPGARVTLAGQEHTHQFTRPGEQHRFTVTAKVEPNEAELRLEFMDRRAGQAAMEIVSVHVNGAPMGLHIYQCEYTPYDTGETLRSHLYLGWPGTWRLRLDSWGMRHSGFGFV